MKLDHSEKRNEKLNIILEVICALILGGAALSMFISMFGLKYSPGEMFSGSFSGGLAGIWNTIADKLGNLDYMILPKYDAPVSDSGKYVYGFTLTIMRAALSVLAYLIIKSRIRLLLLIFAVPAAVLMLGLGLAPSAYAGVLFAAAIIIVLAVMNIRGTIRPAYFIVPLAAVLISSGVLFVMDNAETLDEPKALSDYAENLKAGMDSSRYGSDPLPGGNVGALSGKDLKGSRGTIDDVKAALGMPAVAGEVAENGAPVAESETDSSGKGSDTALTVTMSEPDSYYLRGFVGATYEKNKWNTLPNSTFYAMRDQMYWLNKRGFDGLSELSYASKLGGVGTKDIKFKVDVKGASKKNAFIPYELMLEPAEGEKARASEMVLPAGTKNYGGSYLGTTGFSGKNTYSYTTSSNITGIWTDAVGKFYTAQQTEDIARFFISESHYNVDVYEKYLDIPDRLTPVFEQEIGPSGDISSNHADYKETIDIISRYLREKYIYSETFDSVGGVAKGTGAGSGSTAAGSSSGNNAAGTDSGVGSTAGGISGSGGSDFVQAFVEAKRGCDVHFATLAALLFRYYGIPARYVEGYLITPANIAGAMGETEVNVPAAANHAWTEIYIDGFGWIPFEATPDYSGIMHEADLSRGLQNLEYENNQNNQIDVEEEQPDDEDNEDEDDLKTLLLKILKILLIVLASIILLVIAVLIGIRILRYVRWRKAFDDKDPKAGVRALYQYSAEKKWKLTETGEDLGLRASYSTESMTEIERAAMKKEVDNAKERAKAEKAKERAEAAKARERAEAAKAKERARAEKAEERAEAAKVEVASASKEKQDTADHIVKEQKEAKTPDMSEKDPAH